MGASPKHKYYGEIYFERPLAGIGSVKSYSSDDIDEVLAYFKADAQSAHMKCDAQIYEREKPFGKLEKTRKLSHKEIMGEELTHREKIGIELRNVRIKRGLTIYELGNLCGMVPTTISKIENGRYNVSVDILGKVADALGYKLTFEPKEITLQWLADRLNSVEDWPLWANAVIERMGWIDETGNDYGICSDGEYRLSYDDNMVAVVNRIE